MDLVALHKQCLDTSSRELLNTYTSALKMEKFDLCMAIWVVLNQPGSNLKIDEDLFLNKTIFTQWSKYIQ